MNFELRKLSYDKNSHLMISDNIPDAEWENIKASYQVGDFKMDCCGGIAIPKTSQYGVKFFAHYSGECDTSPESKWHKETKALVLNTLQQLMIDADEEVTGGKSGSKWKADIYFETEDRKIAIEIQHSYQHLNDYKKRQARYANDGVEAFWLLYLERFKTITKSIAIHSIKNVYGGKSPQNIRLGCLPDLPLMLYLLEPEKKVVGICCPGYSLKGWLQSIIDKSFIFRDDVWKIC